ncbi:hypothetical protein NYZ09_19960, partial [Acinetobacter baumannii]|nr:hypothetical protein [Acinetobacter baumannii]
MDAVAFFPKDCPNTGLPILIGQDFNRHDRCGIGCPSLSAASRNIGCAGEDTQGSLSGIGQSPQRVRLVGGQ